MSFTNRDGSLLRLSMITDTVMAIHGDSIASQSPTTPGLLSRIDNLRVSGGSNPASLYMCGTSGIGFGFSFGGAPAMVNDLARTNLAVARGYASSYLFIYGGGNDIALNAKTGAQTYALFQTYIAAQLAAGWLPAQIIVYTISSRNDVPEGDRTTLNSSLVTGAGTYGYKLARLDLDPNMGQAGQYSNTTYFLDNVHHTATGQALAASIGYAAM